MAGGRKVSKEQSREWERRAWELRQQGWTQGRIAVALGVDSSAVCRILARLRERYLRELTRKISRYKAEQTAQLEHLYDRALQAFEMSQLPEVLGGSARPGDHRFLEQARSVLADIRKIWGLDAPTQLEHAGAGGGPIPIVAIEAVRPVGVICEPAGADNGQREAPVALPPGPVESLGE